jgi:hypothetical protein
MQRSRTAFAAAIFFLLAPFALHASEAAGFNTGFVKDTIWYSKSTLTERDAIAIYTAVFNADDQALSGTVVFYDKTIILDKKSFSAPPHEVVTVSIDWNVTAGDHLIKAEIINTTMLKDGKAEPVYLTENATAPDTFTVAKTIAPSAATSGAAPAATPSASAIGQSIADHVPAAIAAPVGAAANTVDAWRATAAIALTDDKVAAKKEIDAAADAPLATVSIGTKGTTVAPTSTTLKTPIAYAKLFFFTAAAFVFGNKFLFYGLCALILFLIIRAIWRRFSDR